MLVLTRKDAREFLDKIDTMRKENRTEKEIATHFDMSVSKLRKTKSYWCMRFFYEKVIRYMKLKESGKSRNEIAEILKIPESNLRVWDREIEKICSD